MVTHYLAKILFFIRIHKSWPKYLLQQKNKFSIRFHERELIRSVEMRLKLILTNTLTDN